MGLLTKLNETSLRSLRYGKDRIDGGSSNQPYITKSIPNNDSSLGNTGGPDFLLRGGTLTISKTADDVSRLTKMFFDTKSFNGFGFIAKQNLLSRTGVKTQAGGQEIYLPTSTLAQAGVSAFGLHFYKQGLNPIPIPSNGTIISLGPLGAISPTGNIISYSQVVPVGNNNIPSNNTTFNRLFQLYDVKILDNPNIYDGNNISSLNNGILQYGGGPGSILGIGPTNIKFADQRTGINNVYGKDIVIGKYQTQRWNGRTVNSFLQPSLVAPIGFKYIGFNGDNISIQDEYNLIPLITKTGGYTWDPNFNISVYKSGTLEPEPEKIGSDTWTPNQNLANGRIWSNLAANVSQYTLQSVTQKYSETNGIGLSIPTNDQKYVYKSGSSVGWDSELFSTLTPSIPNQDTELDNIRKFKGSDKQNLVYNYNPTLPTGSEKLPFNSLKYIYDPKSTKDPNNPTNYNSIVLKQDQIEIYGDFNKDIKFSPTIKDFRKDLRDSLMTGPNIAPNYETFNIEQRVNLGNPGSGRNVGNKAKQKYDYNVGSAPWNEALDKITAMPIYQSSAVTSDFVKNDLVKFRIAIIDNDNPSQKIFIHFRAFLDSFSDAYNADWTATKLLGRGENFYTYGGFTREISMGWTMAAQSKQELIPMYQKLNYLASTLTPDFSKTTGYMKGNLAQLTVGGYLYEQPGIIKGLTYTIEETSPWEIGINTNGGSDNNVKELAQIIKVSGFTFIPIHEFIPRKQNNTYNGSIGTRNQTVSNWGPERYIALSTADEGHNNYDINPTYIPSEQTSTDLGPPPTPPTPPTVVPSQQPTPRGTINLPNTLNTFPQDNTLVNPPTQQRPRPFSGFGGGRFGGAGAGGNW